MKNLITCLFFASSLGFSFVALAQDENQEETQRRRRKHILNAGVYFANFDRLADEITLLDHHDAQLDAQLVKILGWSRAWIRQDSIQKLRRLKEAASLVLAKTDPSPDLAHNIAVALDSGLKLTHPSVHADDRFEYRYIAQTLAAHAVRGNETAMEELVLALESSIATKVKVSAQALEKVVPALGWKNIPDYFQKRIKAALSRPWAYHIVDWDHRQRDRGSQENPLCLLDQILKPAAFLQNAREALKFFEANSKDLPLFTLMQMARQMHLPPKSRTFNDLAQELQTTLNLVYQQQPELMHDAAFALATLSLTHHYELRSPEIEIALAHMLTLKTILAQNVISPGSENTPQSFLDFLHLKAKNQLQRFAHASHVRGSVASLHTQFLFVPPKEQPALDLGALEIALLCPDCSAEFKLSLIADEHLVLPSVQDFLHAHKNAQNGALPIKVLLSHTPAHVAASRKSLSGLCARALRGFRSLVLPKQR